MTKWSKNQIMMLIGLLFSFVALMISSGNMYYYFKLSHQQTIVIQQVDQIQSKIGDFEKIFVKNIQFKTNKSSIQTNNSIFFNSTSRRLGIGANETCLLLTDVFSVCPNG